MAFVPEKYEADCQPKGGTGKVSDEVCRARHFAHLVQEIPADIPQGDQPGRDADGADRQHEPEEKPDLGAWQEVREQPEHSHDHARKPQAWSRILLPVADEMVKYSYAEREREDCAQEEHRSDYELHGGREGEKEDQIENYIAQMEWSIEFGEFRHPNTKVETVKRKPFLQKLLATNRCLVPVNRFYEWPDAKLRPKYKGIKTRFCIHTPEDVMLLGGIYRINDNGGIQFNVLTTDPNPAVSDFHHRMPVIVPPASVHTWMASQDLRTLYRIAEPYRGELVIYACEPYVDSGRHEGPRCMAPLSAKQPPDYN